MNPLSAAGVDVEIKYKIAGQDYIYDLLLCTDILSPIVDVMNASQGLMEPIWKAYNWSARALSFLKSIDIKLCYGLPLLSENVYDLKNMIYKHQTLLDGYIVVEEENSSSPELATRKKSNQKRFK